MDKIYRETATFPFQQITRFRNKIVLKNRNCDIIEWVDNYFKWSIYQSDDLQTRPTETPITFGHIAVRSKL